MEIRVGFKQQRVLWVLSMLSMVLSFLGCTPEQNQVASAEKPAQNSALSAITRAVYLKEGFDSILVNGVWQELDRAVYEEEGLHVVAKPLLEYFGGKLVGKAGQERIVPIASRERERRIKPEDPFVVSVDALAQALGLEVLLLENEDEKGCAIVLAGTVDPNVPWQQQALYAHWDLLEVDSGIHYDEARRPIYQPKLARAALSLLENGEKGHTDALFAGGYFDIVFYPANSKPEVLIALQPLDYGRMLLNVVFLERTDAALWFQTANQAEGELFGPAQARSAELIAASKSIFLEALSKKWGRSISLGDLFFEARQETGRLDLLVTGWGDGGGAAQALVHDLVMSGGASLVGYTFGAVRGSYARLDTMEAPLPLYNALVDTDFRIHGGAWVRPGAEHVWQKGTAGLAFIQSPLEALRGAQALLRQDPSPEECLLAWRLTGGPNVQQWNPEDLGALKAWVNDQLPKRLGVSPTGLTVNTGELQALKAAAADAAQGLDLYKECIGASDTEWTIPQNPLAYGDAVLGNIRLLDRFSQLAEACELTPEAYTKAIDAGKWEYEGVQVTLEALDPSEPEAYYVVALSSDQIYIQGPRGVQIGDSMAEVMSAFPGSIEVSKEKRQILFRKNPEAPVDHLEPPYGLAEQGEVLRITYGISGEAVPKWLFATSVTEDREILFVFEYAQDALSKVSFSLK